MFLGGGFLCPQHGGGHNVVKAIGALGIRCKNARSTQFRRSFFESRSIALANTKYFEKMVKIGHLEPWRGGVGSVCVYCNNSCKSIILIVC